MNHEKGLLDKVADYFNVVCVSDLHYVPKSALRMCLYHISNEADYPDKEWQDAYQYLELGAFKKRPAG